MAEEAYRPISKKLLRESDRLVVAYPRTGGGLNTYALTIKRKARISMEYNLFQEIPAGDFIDLGLMGENGHSAQVDPGDDVFRLPDTKEPFLYWVYHFSMLFNPGGLKIFTGFPESSMVQGMYRETAVTVDTDIGFEWSQHTRFDEMMPSDALELVIPPGNAFYVGISNPRGIDITPKMYAYGAAYDIAPINIRDMRVARDVVVGKIPRTVASFGGLRVFDLNIPDQWGDPVILERDEIALLKRGD